MFKKITFLFLAIALNCLIAYGEEVFPFLGETTVKNVNVRAGQSTNFEQLCKLDEGEEVVVVAKEFSWYKIKLPLKAKCFVSAKYVKEILTNVGMITANNVNLRVGKGEKYSSVGKVSKDTLVKINAKSNDWYEIEPPDNSYGWIHEQFLAFKSRQIPPSRAVAFPSRSVYKKTEEISDGVNVAQESTKAPPIAKAQPTVPPKELDLFAAIGYIEDLGRVAAGEDIRYKLVIDGKTAYYLQGPRDAIDDFVHYKAKVQGKIRKDPKWPFAYPVIIVMKINLVL